MRSDKAFEYASLYMTATCVMKLAVVTGTTPFGVTFIGSCTKAFLQLPMKVPASRQGKP